jgi:hypothetical protein
MLQLQGKLLNYFPIGHYEHGYNLYWNKLQHFPLHALVVISFGCEFSHFFNLTNMISTHGRNFVKTVLLICQIYKFLKKIARIFTTSSSKVHKIKKDFYFKKLSYLVCSQISLNLFVDNCQFGYITKLKKQTLRFSTCVENSRSTKRL